MLREPEGVKLEKGLREALMALLEGCSTVVGVAFGVIGGVAVCADAEGNTVSVNVIDAPPLVDGVTVSVDTPQGVATLEPVAARN